MTAHLPGEGSIDLLTTVLAVASTVLLLFRVNSTWLVLTAALVGFLHDASFGTH